MKTPRNLGEFEANKKHFNEYILQKKKFSIAREIIIIVKTKKNWYEGITITDLMKKIIENFKAKGYYKKRKIAKQSIYDSVMDINLYRDDVYIVSAKGINLKTNKYEFRYFCPYDYLDINKTKELLQRNIFRSGLKEDSLNTFEEEIKHEEEIEKIKTNPEIIITNEN